MVQTTYKYSDNLRFIQKWRGIMTFCHCDERSDVAISDRQCLRESFQ